MLSSFRVASAVLALGFILAAAAGAAQAQGGSAGRDPTSPSAAAPSVRLAMLDIAFYGKRANDLRPGDSLLAGTATSIVRSTLEHAAGVALVNREAVLRARTAPAAVAAASGRPCDVVVACARAVGQALDAPWVLMGKLSKTSDLIWVFSGELIDVRTGALVMDDSYELKGIAADMVPRGAQVFARRVAKRLAAGDSTAAAAR